VTATRPALALLAAAVLVPPLTAGVFTRKKVDAARVKQLVEVLRSDADERKRRAAIAELKDADPRTHTDAVLALVGSLQNDPAPAVRSDAADAIRQLKLVIPLAGLALETAAESDSSPHVRDAARQALWEYHLAGYRSAKGADGFAGQTPEPPLAKPPARVAKAAAAPVVIPVAAVKPQELVSFTPPKAAPPVPVPTPSPGIRTVVSAAPPAVLNATAEPPLAKKLRR
jgi:hypothetical protein